MINFFRQVLRGPPKMPNLSRKRARRTTEGGCFTCTHCNAIATYGHKCPKCGRYFHTLCMLSMHHGEKTLCIECFESGKGDVNALDFFTHDPYNNGEVPFHPFTKRYADVKYPDHKAAAEKDDSEEEAPAKKKARSKATVQKEAAAKKSSAKKKNGI